MSRYAIQRSEIFNFFAGFIKKRRILKEIKILIGMITTDVCIVGSGPSGACTSMMLSKMKIRHVLIDKSEFPRDKTCGDGLVLYTFKAMKLVNPELLERFISNPKFIHSFHAKFYIKDSLAINVDNLADKAHPPIFYGKRIDFDHFLVENCPSPYMKSLFGKSVAKFERTGEGTLLTLNDGTTVLAKIVVGADGNQSFVSRKIAQNSIDHTRSSTFISAYFKGMTGLKPNHEAEIRIIRKKMPLFFYIFPLPNGEANVSLGGLTADIQKYKIDLKKEIGALIGSHPRIKDKFVSAEQLGNWRGWGIPCNFGYLKVYGDGFLLVGDAAGLANAFYKEGVGTGMMSGIIAAEKIREALEANDFSEAFLSDYEVRLESELGKLLRYSRVILKAARNPRIFNVMIFFLKRRIERKIERIIDTRTY